MTDDAPLYLSDEQIAKRIGVCIKTWRIAVRGFEGNHQGPIFPRKDALFSSKRRWDKVKAFLDRRDGVHPGAPVGHDPGTEEPFDAPRTNQRRTRPSVSTPGQ